MAAPDKNKTKKRQSPKVTIASLDKRVVDLEKIVLAMSKQLEGDTSADRGNTSIQRVEDFNGEKIPETRDENKLKMDFAGKIASMDNAIKILPPNYIKEGRHSVGNIQAICGFTVTPEMMNNVYSRFKHENGFVVPVQ